MATSQYIGARYVPLFADPYEWSNAREYEPLTIVYNNGNSYTSRQYVPKGIDISNGDYWALTGNYNAQVEQYRKEVLTYDTRITTAQSTADTASTTAGNALSLAQTNEKDIASNDAELAGTAESGLKTLIESETARATAAEGAEEARATAAEKKNADAISAEETRAKTAEKKNEDAISAEETRATAAEQANTAALNAKFPVATASIDDGAVTAAKLATTAVNSILNGFTVHHFDSADATADNEGLVVPSEYTTLAGFYVEELTLLVITQIGGSDSWPNAGNTIKLPNYVPSVSKQVQFGGNSILLWNSSNNFVDWTNLYLNSGGWLRPKTSSGSNSTIGNGALVAYLRPYITDALSASDQYAALVNQNGVM